MKLSEHRKKFMVETIKDGRRDNVSMSWDYDDNEDDISQRRAVILYVPDTEHHEHSHIEFTNDQAAHLRDWLTRYLESVNYEKTSD